MTGQRMALGKVYITPGVEDHIRFETVVASLDRHSRGDWGEISDHDKDVNAEALENGEQVMSAYTSHGVKFWIITEADRSITTVLLPDEY